VGCKAGLDAVEKRKINFPCREAKPGSQAHSPSLCRLGYPGSSVSQATFKIIYYSVFIFDRSVRLKESVNRAQTGNPLSSSAFTDFVLLVFSNLELISEAQLV
jgi:hypothetical protein